MKFDSTAIRQELLKVLDWLDYSQLRKIEVGKANDLCDGFEQNARRVPRNICADPEVEAKRAVCGTLRNGVLSLKKSISNCLNEADDDYIAQFGRALSEAACEYFDLQLVFSITCADDLRQIKIEISNSAKSSQIQLLASCRLAKKDASCIGYLISSELPGGKLQESDDVLSLWFAKD